MSLFIVQLCLMAWYLCPVNAANIIVALPLDVRSHLQFSEAIVKTLLDAGHNVTYVTSILPSKPLGNCSIIDFRENSQEKPVPFSLSLRTGWWIYIIRAAVESAGEKFCFSMRMKKALVYLAVLLFSFDWIDAANIIAFLPIDLKSSAIFSEAIVKTLVHAGHDVTYVTAIPLNEPLANCTVVEYQSDSTTLVVSPPSSLFDFGWVTYALRGSAIQKERLCFSEGVKKSMNHLKNLKKKFDLLIIPLTFYPKCFLPVAQEFDIPYVGINALRSFWYHDMMIGNPRNLAVTPFDFSSFYTERNFWTRLWHTVDQLTFMYIFQDYDDAIYDSRFTSQFPNFKIDQVPKMSLVFLNNHQSILPRPLGPNTVEVGGLHISKTAKELPQHIKTFLDEAKNGVILFSLGTLVQSNVFDDEKRRILLNVFGKIPERVIWKFSEKLPNLPANVLTTKWLPQRDILAHKNVKAFITHSGFFGTQEAVYESKPLIMMPMNLDQPGNAALMYQKGVGEYLELSSLTEEKLFNTIRGVIDNKKYRENMENLSAAYKDRPMSPEETLIYWTQYVLRHKGAKHFQTTVVDMPFYQYFLLDVLLFLFFICVCLFWASYFILKQIFQYFSKKSELLKTNDLKKQN